MVLNTGDLVSVDFPGVTGVKRRPAVILSSATYHAIRPDIIAQADYISNKGIGRDRLHSSGLGCGRITS
jgi:mRNA interferase MazF